MTNRTALLRCPWCGDTGMVTVAVTRAEHHPLCDVTCHPGCPIPVMEADYEPCDRCGAAQRVEGQADVEVIGSLKAIVGLKLAKRVIQI